MSKRKYVTNNIFPVGLGFAFFIGIFLYGPIDLPRAVYNQLTGDADVLKRQLVNYIICQEKKNTPSKQEVVVQLAKELKVPLNDEAINPEDIAFDDLFEAAEERSNFMGRFIWLELDDYKNPSCAK